MSGLPRELGDFVLEKLIGQGGMGEVYFGRQKSLDRPVAIKLLRDEYARDESFIARFKREAKSAAKLIHQNIIQVYQLGEAGGEYYFAMEFVEGKDLQIILKENKGKLNTAESVRIIFNVAKALEIAGSFGIVHRDIKPSNVLITKDGSIKVMDFGLAKAFQDSSTNVTMSGAVMGTANYMSPEQAEGRDVDQRTDIYSLGVMFYQLLTGYLPFSGENPTSLAFQHVHSKPIPPMEKIPGVSKALNDICIKCLAKKKEDRYQSATELIVDLQAATDGSNTNYSLNSSTGVGKSMIDASSEATIVSSNDPTLLSSADNDKTFAPSMSAPTRVEHSSVTKAGPQTVSNTVLLGGEKTEIKLEDNRADSGRLSTASEKKTNLMIPIVVVLVVLVAVGIWAMNKEDPNKPQKPKSLNDVAVVNNTVEKNDVTITKQPDDKVPTDKVVTTTPKEIVVETVKEDPKETPKDNIKETPKEVKETIKFLPPDETKAVVEVSLDDLKSKLSKGFKVRVGVLDDLNQHLKLDDIKVINRMPGKQKLELTHDYYYPVVAEIKIEANGTFSLKDIPPPAINHDKVIQQIDNYLLSSRKDELTKMLSFGFADKDLELLKDRIRILDLEIIARDIFKKGGTTNLVRAYNLLVPEQTLSLDGGKLKAEMKALAEKDAKIRVSGNLLEEVKETIITNSIGMTFEIIEPGEFEMGSSVDPQNPKRKVKISKRFAMGRYEVTNKELREFFPRHSCTSFLNLEMNGDSQPAVFVEWLTAKQFCEKLSQKEGKKYRLPTEAEWEYCARGGVATEYTWGSKPEEFNKSANLLDSGVPDTLKSGKEPFAIADGFVVTAPVGSFPANRFKLFDMDGNVSEWVSGYFVEGPSVKDGEVDPRGPNSGSKKCVRGGSFKSDGKTGSLAYKQGVYDDVKSNDIGFRVVLELNETK